MSSKHPAGYTSRNRALREEPITSHRLARAIEAGEVRTIAAGTRMVLVNLADIRRLLGPAAAIAA